MTPGRLWWLFRRDLKRGFDAAYHDYKTLRRIEEWSWPFWHEVAQTTPVHVLTGEKDWWLAAWMLASWFEASEKGWPVVIHDDGTLPDEGVNLLQKLFPNARIIRRAEADAAMARVLQAFPFCEDYRAQHPLALKLFDVPHFCASERYLMFDSDLLFFHYPHDILEWTGSERDECWFNEDVQEGALITAAEARDELEVKIWPRVNSGLASSTSRPSTPTSSIARSRRLRSCAGTSGEWSRRSTCSAPRGTAKAGSSRNATKSRSIAAPPKTRCAGTTSARCAIVSMPRD